MEIACRKFGPIEFGRFGSGRLESFRLEATGELSPTAAAHTSTYGYCGIVVLRGKTVFGWFSVLNTAVC